MPKILSLILPLLVSFQLIHATAIQSTGAGGNWNNPASWSPAQVPVAGDNVTINSASPVTVTAAAACASVTINAGAALTLNGGNLNVSSNCTVRGTLDCKDNYLLTGSGSFSLNAGATLGIGNPYGITTGNGTGATAGSIQTTGGGRSYPSNVNYIYDGTVNQTAGNGLPNTINSGAALTISNTGIASNNTVTLIAANNNFQNINLTAGLLSLNSKTITVNGGTILATGGNLDTNGVNGMNGGNIIIQGATLTGPVIFHNLAANSSASTITTTGLNAPIVKDTFSVSNIASGAHLNGSNSIRYAAGSLLLYINADNRGTEWNADLSTPAIAGVTPGYPYNVAMTSGSDFYIVNYKINGAVGAVPRGLAGDLITSQLTLVDWQYYTNPADPMYLNPVLLQTGTFTVGGNMIVNGGGNIHMVKGSPGGAFTVMGNLTINGGGANLNIDSLTAPFTVNGNMTLNGGTFNGGGFGANVQINGNVIISSGTFNEENGTVSLTGNWTKTGGTLVHDSGTVRFNGTTPQTLTQPATDTLFSLSVNNAAGLTLTNNTNIAGDLTLTNGLVNTGANLLQMSGGNASVNRVSGTVNGTVKRYITTASKAYVFPVGDATHYTPATLTFSSVTTPGYVTVDTHTPFTSVPGYGSLALSKTRYADRYWTLMKNSGSFGTYTGVFDYGTTNLAGGATIGNLKAGLYDGSAWSYPSSTGAGTAVTASAVAALGSAPVSVVLAGCTPPATHNVTGGGSYCSGTGLPVELDGSETGVSYQLQKDGTDLGSAVSGTNNALNFGNQDTGTYTVIATDVAAGCSVNMNGSAVIALYTPATVTFTTAPGATICSNSNQTYATQPGQSAYIWAISGTAGTDYNVTSGGTPADNSLVLKWLTGGNQTVSVSYTDAHGCVVSTAADTTVTINTTLTPSFTSSPPAVIYQNTTVTYTTQAGQTGYDWTVPGSAGMDYIINAGGTSPADYTVTLTWLTAGIKTVKVNYMASSGCTVSGDAIATTTVLAGAAVLPVLSIPSSFSPNGDHVHDTWYITNIEQYPDAEVSVFNRYGQFVFQSQGNYAAHQWDGTLKGTVLPIGTYYYIIDLNISGHPPLTGSVSIIR